MEATADRPDPAQLPGDITPASGDLGEAASPSGDRAGLCVFDPSPLLTVTIEPGSSRAADDGDIHFHAGGQGFWIARMARRLGATVTLVGSLGGETGMLLAPLMREHGITVSASRCAGPNGSYVQDRRSGERETLAESPPTPLTRHEVDDLYGATLTAALNHRVVVLAGPGAADVVPAELYGRLAADLRTFDIPVVADLSGEALPSALTGGIDVLKVSEDDARRDGLLTGEDLADLLQLMDDLHRRGAAAVVLTRADHPALAFVEQTPIQILCPPLHVVDHRGAGDAMTAAVAVALASGASLTDALRLGAAAGAAAVTRRGLASGRQDAVGALVPYVEIQQLSEE